MMIDWRGKTKLGKANCREIIREIERARFCTSGCRRRYSGQVQACVSAFDGKGTRPIHDLDLLRRAPAPMKTLAIDASRE
jgi:hypothetical protein